MGNQLSADRDKDKVEKERLEKERLEKQQAKGNVTGGPSSSAAGTVSPRVERQRSRTITSTTTCPPTETKINANAEQPIVPLERPLTSIPATPVSLQTTPLAERRSGKSTAAREIINAAKTLNIKELPKQTEEEVKQEAEEIASTPKFETARVPSETSVLDEEDLNNIDEGIPPPLVPIL